MGRLVGGELSMATEPYRRYPCECVCASGIGNAGITPYHACRHRFKKEQVFQKYCISVCARCPITDTHTLMHTHP